MKSPRWRASNKAYNRDGIRQAINEAKMLKKLQEEGKARVKQVTIEPPKGLDAPSITLRTVTLKY